MNILLGALIGFMLGLPVIIIVLLIKYIYKEYKDERNRNDM